MYLPAANTLAFSNNGSETMRINSSGNVGIGTSSPSTLLHTSGTVTSNVATGNVAGYVMSVNGTATGYLGSSASSTTLDSRGATFLSFQTNGSERARIDSSGNLLVGATTYAGSGLSLSTPNSSGSYSVFAAGDTGYHWRFGNVSNGIVGAITTSTTATTYSTSSDYRLKENIAPMTGALSVVQQLKPCTYIWKADGSDGQGFIAHELAEVCPQCVTGEKDAVDAEGKPVYQGIDTSFLVATLTAAIQEQQALINELRARVAALESQP
jgi:hypothetical protein